jgi:hypothetical protein
MADWRINMNINTKDYIADILTAENRPTFEAGTNRVVNQTLAIVKIF